MNELREGSAQAMVRRQALTSSQRLLSSAPIAECEVLHDQLQR